MGPADQIVERLHADFERVGGPRCDREDCQNESGEVLRGAQQERVGMICLPVWLTDTNPPLAGLPAASSRSIAAAKLMTFR